MVTAPGTLLRIWDDLLVTPHLRHQAIAPMARKPTLTGSPNRSSHAVLRSREELGFDIGATNFTRGTAPRIIRFPEGEIRAQVTRWIAEEFERLYRLCPRRNRTSRPPRTSSQIAGEIAGRRASPRSDGAQGRCHGRSPSRAAW